MDSSDIEQPTQLAQKLAAGKFSICVEMDPPRGLSTHKLLAGASLLYDAGADVINVADSPMARMRMSAWAVCDLVQRKIGVETTLHFPTRGRNLLRVQGDLLAAHAIGLRNIFVVMGDPTSIGDYPEATDNYDLVPSGLVKLIKQGFNMGVDHSGTSIGQPTNFFVGAALNLCPKDMDNEVKNLHRKIKAGADFFLTQPIYRPTDGPNLIEAYEAKHGKLDKPILAGILPLVSAKHANFLHNEVPGVFIPEEARKKIEADWRHRKRNQSRRGTGCRIDPADQGLGKRRLLSCRNSIAMIWSQRSSKRLNRLIINVEKISSKNYFDRHCNSWRQDRRREFYVKHQ